MSGDDQLIVGPETNHTRVEAGEGLDIQMLHFLQLFGSCLITVMYDKCQIKRVLALM